MKIKPFDFNNEKLIFDQIYDAVMLKGVSINDFTNQLGMNRTSFYNRRNKDSKAIVNIRKMLNYLRKKDPNFEIDFANEATIFEQIKRKSKSLGVSPPNLCKRIRIPEHYLYTVKETETVGLLREIWIYFS